jgi:hypothetical protein
VPTRTQALPHAISIPVRNGFVGIVSIVIVREFNPCFKHKRFVELVRKATITFGELGNLLLRSRTGGNIIVDIHLHNCL